MDINILKTIVYLLLTIGILLAVLFSLKWILKQQGQSWLLQKKGSFKIIERFALDQKRQLVRLQDDQREYLLLLGSQSEQVLNSKDIS